MSAPPLTFTFLCTLLFVLQEPASKPLTAFFFHSVTSLPTASDTLSFVHFLTRRNCWWARVLVGTKKNAILARTRHTGASVGMGLGTGTHQAEDPPPIGVVLLLKQLDRDQRLTYKSITVCDSNVP